MRHHYEKELLYSVFKLDIGPQFWPYIRWPTSYQSTARIQIKGERKSQVLAWMARKPPDFRTLGHGLFKVGWDVCSNPYELCYQIMWATLIESWLKFMTACICSGTRGTKNPQITSSLTQPRVSSLGMLPSFRMCGLGLKKRKEEEKTNRRVRNISLDNDGD